MLRSVAIALFVLLIAACTGETADTTLPATTQLTTTTTATPTTTIEDLSEEFQAAQDRIEELEGEIEALRDELSQEAQAREDAESAREEALAELEALRLAYDDEIQEILDNGVAAVVDSSCSAIDEALDESQVANLIDRQIGDWADQPGLPENSADALDREAIEAQVAECAAAAAEEARLAELREPKGDGFWTVGEEIAPGTWESQGNGDGCYWARLDENQEILDNHFGSAGGRITIRSSDTEVEFTDCGTWEYQG